jgi:RNA polymerase sigma-70 factor, ECF subfamily
MKRIEKIYDRFGDGLFHYLALKLGSRTDAEDVLQETLYRLLRYRARFFLARNPKAFVFRVARNEAFRFISRNGRNSGPDGNHPEVESVVRSVFEGPDPALAARACGALARIPEAQREVIVLKIFQDLSFREIAAVCGISPGTAASRYRYGLDKLRADMEGQHERSK